MKLNPVWKLLHVISSPGFNLRTNLLFSLYINDLPNSFDELSFRIFADATNISFTNNNAKEVEFTMNEELKLVLKYFAILNNLSVNLKKTNYMLIRSSKKKVYFNIQNIECKSYTKYLGIYIDR